MIYYDNNGTQVFYDYEVNAMYPHQSMARPSLSLIDLPPANWPRRSNDQRPYGWAGEYSIPNRVGFDAHAQMYRDITEWIKGNIERPYKNAHWAKIGDCIYVQIRKKADFTLFMLRWA